jgi:hypothetical protein
MFRHSPSAALLLAMTSAIACTSETPTQPGAGGTAGTSAGGAGTGGRSGGGSSCLGAGLLGKLGKTHVLVGATATSATLDSTPFDLRYLYISGGLFDGTSPCASCATGCTTGGGQSCASASGGCAWWGCWQYDQVPPGVYATNHISAAQAAGQLPMFTYYEILQSSGASEGAGEVAAANGVAFMTRYLRDWRFLAQTIGQNVALLHIEPDFWGYAEQVSSDPHSIPAAVASADPDDCGTLENSIAGLGRCMIAIVRKYAPNARVGLHASSWGTLHPALSNGSASFDVIGEANKLGDFLLACGAADGDFVVADLSDRDAGYAQSQGNNVWWDATNQKLPNFTQANLWTKSLTERMGLPLVWWQIPIGNMAQTNTTDHWQDNRVDYFFGHMGELAASHVVAVAYGAGISGQTTAETDGGNLIAKAKAYAAAGGQALCP